jgi:hypothetical protein
MWKVSPSNSFAEVISFTVLSSRGNSIHVEIDSKHKKHVLNAVKEDVLYAAYKSKVCGGKLTIEEYIGSRALGELSPSSVSGAGGATSSPSGNSSNLLASLANTNRGRSSSTALSPVVESILTRGAIELDGWGEFWDVANAKYAVSKEKVCLSTEMSGVPNFNRCYEQIIHDMSVLTEVASVSQGCDWLVSQLLRLCTSTTRKLPASSGANVPVAPSAGGGGKYGSPVKPRRE